VLAFASLWLIVLPKSAAAGWQNRKDMGKFGDCSQPIPLKMIQSAKPAAQ